MVLDPFFPVSMLREIDGLVISGMGTGSISNSLIETLSPEHTSKMPIIIVSRCANGTNCDDYLYKGSLEKYEKKGFRISGYEHLNPQQARLKLMLEISIHKCTHSERV